MNPVSNFIISTYDQVRRVVTQIVSKVAQVALRAFGRKDNPSVNQDLSGRVSQGRPSGSRSSYTSDKSETEDPIGTSDSSDSETEDPLESFEVNAANSIASSSKEVNFKQLKCLAGDLSYYGAIAISKTVEDDQFRKDGLRNTYYINGDRVDFSFEGMNSYEMQVAAEKKLVESMKNVGLNETQIEVVKIFANQSILYWGSIAYQSEGILGSSRQTALNYSIVNRGDDGVTVAVNDVCSALNLIEGEYLGAYFSHVKLLIPKESSKEACIAKTSIEYFAGPVEYYKVPNNLSDKEFTDVAQKVFNQAKEVINEFDEPPLIFKDSQYQNVLIKLEKADALSDKQIIG